jgi:hypothetical protein
MTVNPLKAILGISSLFKVNKGSSAMFQNSSLPKGLGRHRDTRRKASARVALNSSESWLRETQMIYSAVSAKSNGPLGSRVEKKSTLRIGLPCLVIPVAIRTFVISHCPGPN